MLSFLLFIQNKQKTGQGKSISDEKEMKAEEIKQWKSHQNPSPLLPIQICDFFLQSTYLPINRINGIVK